MHHYLLYRLAAAWIDGREHDAARARTAWSAARRRPRRLRRTSAPRSGTRLNRDPCAIAIRSGARRTTTNALYPET
jgi:hypothetical protein